MLTLRNHKVKNCYCKLVIFLGGGKSNLLCSIPKDRANHPGKFGFSESEVKSVIYLLNLKVKLKYFHPIQHVVLEHVYTVEQLILMPSYTSLFVVRTQDLLS